MGIMAQDLFDLARTVENRIAELYEEISRNLPDGSEEAAFFARMAAQEHMHSAWVDEMAASLVEDILVESIDAADFRHILTTIDDVHDEVITEDIDVCGALEIIQHLETTAAEEFYFRFPDDLEGLPKAMLERMTNSCREHAKSVQSFQQRYACRLPKRPSL